MDPKDRQRLKLLGVLLVVLVLTFWLGQRDNEVPALQPTESNESAAAPDMGQRLAPPILDGESLARAPSLDAQDRRNPFQYGPEPSLLAVETVELPPGARDLQESTANIGPAPPPPPPPIPFSYRGFALVGPHGEAKALLEDENRSFAVSQDEVLMGRYRINVVNRAFVEIEDLEFGRRQRLPLDGR